MERSQVDTPKGVLTFTLGFRERTVFGDASGECLAKIVDLPEVGNVGALSCWEHIQPLLKYYTFSQGEQIHVAGWPPLDAFIDGSPGFYSMSIEGEQAHETCANLISNLLRLPKPIPVLRHRVPIIRAPLHRCAYTKWYRNAEDSWKSRNGCTYRRQLGDHSA